ncbi:hypothetical protein LCGC14_2760230 [marine sediment metagenome]|uniref:Uncharacterized protein n=1 Tax=marine sediment metagenome TaxID=412755 RepID=A0A0F8YZ81_9ZZZZ
MRGEQSDWVEALRYALTSGSVHWKSTPTWINDVDFHHMYRVSDVIDLNPDQYIIVDPPKALKEDNRP